MLIEDIINFLSGLSTGQLIAYFWPFFLLDITRYLLLDLIVILIYVPKRTLSQAKYLQARRKLYKQRPLISVIVPGKNEAKHIPRLAESLNLQT